MSVIIPVLEGLFGDNEIRWLMKKINNSLGSPKEVLQKYLFKIIKWTVFLETTKSWVGWATLLPQMERTTAHLQGAAAENSRPSFFFPVGQWP